MTRAAITQCHLLPLPGSCLRSPTGAAWSPLPGVGGFSRAGPCPATALPAPHPGTHRWRHRKGRRSQGSPTRLRDVGPWAQGGQPGGRGGGQPTARIPPALRSPSAPPGRVLLPQGPGCLQPPGEAGSVGRGTRRTGAGAGGTPSSLAGVPAPHVRGRGSPPCPSTPRPRPLPGGGSLAPPRAPPCPSDVTQVVSPPSPRRPSRPSPPAAAPRPAAQSPAGEGRGGRAPANGERINTSSGGGARRASESTGVPAAQ